MRRKWAHVAILCSLLFCMIAWQKTSVAGPSADDYQYNRYGYLITLPGDWTIAQHDCDAAVYVRSPDRLAILEMFVGPTALPKSQLAQIATTTMAQLGKPISAARPIVKTLSKARFVALGGLVRTSSGTTDQVSILATNWEKLSYLFVGIVRSNNSPNTHLRMVQVSDSFKSIQFQQGVNTTPASCPPPTPSVPPTSTPSPVITGTVTGSPKPTKIPGPTSTVDVFPTDTPSPTVTRPLGA